MSDCANEPSAILSTITALGSFLSGLAVVASIIIFWKQRKIEKKRDLADKLDAILKLSVEYPYLEFEGFTKTWNSWKDNNKFMVISEEKYIRYDNYCVLVFNYLSKFCEFYDYNKDKINKELDVQNWIRIHQQCWENPSTPYENVDGYNKKFRDLISSYLK